MCAVYFWGYVSKCFETKLWLISAHPRERPVATLLSSAPLRWGMTEGRLSRARRSSLWSTYRVREAARCLVIPPTTTTAPPLPSHFIIPSTSPWQTRSALYQRTAGYLSFPSPLFPFLPSGPHPICHLHRLGLGQLKGTRCRCQAWPGGLGGAAGKGKATGSPCGSV